MRQRPQLADVLPPQDLRQYVSSRDEEQLRLWVLLVKFAQRVDGVGQPRPVDVDARDVEPRVGGRGDDGHEVAVLRGRDGALLFEYRLARGDEEHLVELEVVSDLTCRHEVAVMDRVEGSAHHPQPARCGTHLNGVCRYCGTRTSA